MNLVLVIMKTHIKYQVYKNVIFYRKNMKMGQKQIIDLSDLVKEIFFKDIYNRKMENKKSNLKYI